MLHRLLALLAPPACAACRAPVPLGAEPLCAPCRRLLPWIAAGERCARCGLPRCRRCPARRHAYAAAWAPVAYEGPARALVAALKERGSRAAAQAMAAQIAAGWPGPPDGEGDRGGAAAAGGGAIALALVPVPAHPARRRARGFDHAERLAAALAPRLELPVRRCLFRGGPARRQRGAGREVRLEAGRLRVVARGPVPAVAVLVDDVHTTGATLDACARALRAAGSREVVALAYARTLRR